MGKVDPGKTQVRHVWARVCRISFARHLHMLMLFYTHAFESPDPAGRSH